MSTTEAENNLSTADFAAAAERRPAERQAERVEQVETRSKQERREEEQLAALFAPDVAADFRSRWDAVQIGFVDDPGQSVRRADELVAQVMKSLAQSFASERSRLEQQLGASEGAASTENLRVALRQYRSFFQRLLNL